MIRLIEILLLSLSIIALIASSKIIVFFKYKLLKKLREIEKASRIMMEK